MKRILIVSCIASWFVSAGPAHADTVDIQFSGSVSQVAVDQVFGDIAFGDAFQGTLSFDSTAADLIPEDPSIGSYMWTAPFGMTVSIGAHKFDAFGSLNIGILNSFVDQYTVFATSATGDLDIQMFLLDNTGSTLTDDHLPPGLPTLDGFDERDFQLSGFLNGGGIQLNGEIAAPFAQPIPEPSPVILLVTILVLGYVLFRRRV